MSAFVNFEVDCSKTMVFMNYVAVYFMYMSLTVCRTLVDQVVYLKSFYKYSAVEPQAAYNMVNTIMRMRTFRRKMVDCMYGFQWRECWISATERFQRKPHRSPLPVEYVTEFSGQTDAPEVRCNLTDRHTQTQLQ